MNTPNKTDGTDESANTDETEKPKAGGYTRFGPSATQLPDGQIVEPGDDEHDRFIDGRAELREQARKAASRRPD